MVKGMIMARWDDRLGVVLEAKYPETVTQGFTDDDYLTIFSTHAMSERAGFLAMRIKRLNLASYYSGIPENEGQDQYYVALLLDPQEDPNPFEERLSETARMLIPMVGKPQFDEFFSDSFMRLVKMKEITEEQRFAFIFQDKIRYLMLEKLASGPMTKDGLAKWLSKEVEREVTDIDGLLGPLGKTGLITEINISKGKKVTLEYVFLMRDIAAIRVPAIEIYKAAKGGQMPANLQKPYMDECEKFFKQYRVSANDARIIAGYIADPDKYEIIKVLRKEYLTKVELPPKLAREVQNLDAHLKELSENNIIYAHQDKKKNIWLMLKSDIIFPSFFPDYMIDVIRRRWKEGTIAKEIAIQHLELLRAAYIATENPKYKMKIVLRVEVVMKQVEKDVGAKNYEQAATSLDEIAQLMRDMAEREAGEMITTVGKNMREDKGKYVSEKWEEDRAKILKEIERTHKETEEMGKRKKEAKLEFKAEKKGASEKGEKLEKGKKAGGAAEGYKAPESLDQAIEELGGEEEPVPVAPAPEEKKGKGKKPAEEKKKPEAKKPEAKPPVAPPAAVEEAETEAEESKSKKPEKKKPVEEKKGKAKKPEPKKPEAKPPEAPPAEVEEAEVPPAEPEAPAAVPAKGKGKKAAPFVAAPAAEKAKGKKEATKPPSAPPATPAPGKTPPKPVPPPPLAKPAAKAPPAKPAAKAAPVGDVNKKIKELETKLKAAQKANDQAGVAECYADMAKCYDAMGNKKKADELRATQIDVTKKALIALRKDLENDAKQAEDGEDYAKAAELYGQCKKISQELYKNGEMKEQDNVKAFSNKQKDMEGKASE